MAVSPNVMVDIVHAKSGEWTLSTKIQAVSTRERPVSRRRREPGGVPVREGLLAAGVELARSGGPDAVVLREATRIVGVAPNAAYRHFADRDELLAAVCGEAMRQLAARMAAGVAAVPGERGEPSAARARLGAIGVAYLAFAREEPGLFATAFAVPQQHRYAEPDSATGPERTPLDHLRAQLDELVEAEVIESSRRPGLEYPIWSGVHGLAVLTGQGPLRVLPEDTHDHLAELLFAFVDRALG
jgi:AcrR family transcriptional regulator